MSNYEKIIQAIKNNYIGKERTYLINEIEDLYDSGLFLNILEENDIENWENYGKCVHIYDKRREEEYDNY